ncbi:hypothetical protein GLW05_18500 [Pontibacillus yanchengensis]|uniref:Uncharacterized protein n=2 Tax=Pontibacillus yanchengensis TaxID=462910 RepID=A0A6I5A5D5_9BACI|nr:hypothetical protein [Pontibacillus yanchengensis]
MSNSPEAITEMVRCYFTYALKEELQLIYNDLLIEWEFIDYDISEQQLSTILNIALIIGRDMELLDKMDSTLKYLEEPGTGLSLYQLYYDLNNGVIDYSTGKEKFDNIKNKTTVIANCEQHRLLSLLEHTLLKEHSEIMDNTENKLKENKEEVTKQEVPSIKTVKKLPIKTKFHPKKNVPFEKVSVSLAIYKFKNSKNIHEYSQTYLLKSKGYQEYFITMKQLRKLKRDKEGYWIEVVYLDENFNFDKKSMLNLKDSIEPQQNDKNFKWPTTEINEETSESENNIDLNSKSALRDLGYRITGLSRKERWDILANKAVPKLGLKRVANMIAYLVRGRKSMKDGIKRNRNSITEWEYDLQKLKDKYYRKDFVWPFTDIKKNLHK